MVRAWGAFANARGGETCGRDPAGLKGEEEITAAGKGDGLVNRSKRCNVPVSETYPFRDWLERYVV